VAEISLSRSRRQDARVSRCNYPGNCLKISGRYLWIVQRLAIETDALHLTTTALIWKTEAVTLGSIQIMPALCSAGLTSQSGHGIFESILIWPVRRALLDTEKKRHHRNAVRVSEP